MGLSYTARSCLEVPSVMGYRRVPEPPARIIPFTFASLTSIRSLRGQSAWGQPPSQIRCKGVSPRRDRPQSSVVYAEAFALIAAILYALAPVKVVEVPLDGFADAGFEGFFERPAEFFLDFAGVYGVAHVMAGAVFYVGDQVPVAALLRTKLLEDIADGVHDFDVLFFVVAADVVGFAGFAFGDDFVEGSCVVFNIEPVTDLVAFAVDRERLTFQGVEDHQRDELFREVVGAVVVTAISDQYRQAVGALPGAYQVV